MSGLSAKTYSCGGEGALFRGGDASLAISPLGAFEKNLSIPFFSMGGSSGSDSEGGGGEREEREDKSEASSLAIVAAWGTLNALVLIVNSRACSGKARSGGSCCCWREEKADGSW